MRVLLVTNRYPIPENPGESPAVEQQLMALREQGHRVDLLLIRSDRSRLAFLRAMFRVFWVCQVLGRYDIVHAHYGYSGLVARMQWRCPVVVTFRGSDVMNPRERPFSKVAARLADRSIVMTEEMLHILGMPAEVIPYGTDLGIFKPMDRTEARRSLGLAEDLPIVLFPYDPARRVKRFALAEEAVALLKSQSPSVQLLAVYGKPPATLAKYMNAADVMVMTSEREGAPSAIREAMGCNLPIVSVDVGDVAQVVGGTRGCYVTGQSPREIAEKLGMALSSRARTNGWDAVQEWSTARSAARLTAIYRSLASRGPAGRSIAARDSATRRV